MSSPFEDAFADLLDAQDEARGRTVRITVNGVPYRGIMADITSDEIAAAGGIAESGGFKCQILVSAFNVAPATYDPISTEDSLPLQVLSVNRINEVFEITAGDPLAR